MPSHTHAIESLRSFGARTRQSDSPRFQAMVGRILMRELGSTTTPEAEATEVGCPRRLTPRGGVAETRTRRDAPPT